MEKMIFQEGIPWYEIIKNDFQKAKKGEPAIYPVNPLRTPLYLDRDRIYYFRSDPFVSGKQLHLNARVIEQIIIDLNLLREFVEKRNEKDPEDTKWCLDSLIRPRQKLAESLQIPFVNYYWSVCVARSQYLEHWRLLCQNSIQGTLP